MSHLCLNVMQQISNRRRRSLEQMADHESTVFSKTVIAAIFQNVDLRGARRRPPNGILST